VTFGGLASLKHYYSWVRGRPRIVGHVEQLFLGNVQSDAGQPQAIVLMLTYIVNKHIAPVTIRGWQLTVKKNRREWPANQLSIRDDMIIDWARVVYWAQGSQLYGVDTNVESKKGIRGWLLFVVPGLNSIDPREKTELKLLMRDAVGGRHTIKYLTGQNSRVGLACYPDQTAPPRLSARRTGGTLEGIESEGLGEGNHRQCR
jgi:hypothetical protein